MMIRLLRLLECFLSTTDDDNVDSEMTMMIMITMMMMMMLEMIIIINDDYDDDDDIKVISTFISPLPLLMYDYRKKRRMFYCTASRTIVPN